MFTIMPSLKQISSQVSQHRTILNAYFIKSRQQSSLTLILLVQTKISMNFNKSTACGNRLNFMQLTANLPKKWTQVLLLSHPLVTLNEAIEGQGYANWYQNVETSGFYHNTKFKSNWSVNVWIQTNLYGSVFLTQNYVRFYHLNTKWAQ